MTDKSWIDWPYDECRECGGAVRILTNCPQERTEDISPRQMPPFVYCGDEWECEDGHRGVVYCDTETPVKLE